MFLRKKSAAMLNFLFLLAAMTAGEETRSTGRIESNNNETVVTTPQTTRMYSSTLSIKISSVESYILPIETVTPESSSLPIEKVTTKSSSLPIEKVTTQSSSLPIEKVTTQSSSLPIEKVTTQSSSLPIEKVTTQSSSLPIEKVTTQSSNLPTETVSEPGWSTETKEVNKTLAPPTTTTTPKTPACLEGWAERKGYGACYFVSTDAVVWLDARNTCHNLMASLVSIHSEVENRFVRSLVSNESDYWIGLTADSLRHNRWIDNSPVTWINWQYPSVQPFGNWCGLLLTGGSSGSNTWTQSVCLYNKPFICKKVLYAHTKDKEDKTWVCSGVVAGVVVLLAVALTALAVARRHKQTDVRMPPPSVTDIRAVASRCVDHQFPDSCLSDELSLSFECRYSGAWSTENIYQTVDEDIPSYEHLGYRNRTENVYEPTYSNLWSDSRDNDSSGSINAKQ